MEPISSLVDNIFVGRLNTQWLASLAIANSLINSFTWVFNFLIHATTQNISTAVGKGNQDEILERIKVSLIFALTLGLVGSGILYLCRFPLYQLAGGTPQLNPQIDQYFTIRMLGHTFSLGYMTLISILRGLGKVKVCFYILLWSTLVNIALTYSFLYLWDMQLKGAALGTVLSLAFGMITTLFYLQSKNKIFPKILFIKISGENIFSFGKNSLDLFGRSLMLTVSFFISVRIASSISLTALASHQILLQTWLLSSYLLDGVAVTGTILGAKLLAQKKIKDLSRCYSSLLKIGMGIGLIFTFLYLFFGPTIWSLFTKDTELLQNIVKIWPLVVLVQVFNALAFIYDGLMFGIGEFQFIRKHMIIGVLTIFLPFATLAYYSKTLLFIWVGLSAVNLYRVLSNRLKVKQITG
jgi:putative MATE family efflux protein